MLINGWKTIIVRCSICGKLFEDDFNLFSCTYSRKKEFICECGNSVADLEAKSKRTAILSIHCNLCNALHSYHFNIIDVIINNRIYNCSYGAEICIIGDIKNNINFTDSSIMISSLKAIDELQIKDKVMCKCGSSDIACDIYSDRIELRCKKCNGLMIIYAENEEDLELIKVKKFIELEEGDIRCLGSKKDEMRDLIDLSKEHYEHNKDLNLF
jgi:phage FluMu protein Com